MLAASSAWHYHYNMARRLPQTLADYLVIGVSPALIMLLVGSLVFFLAEIFYPGEYRLRLCFILAMFVMATVCVARIAMAEGAGYAALFAGPLGLVSFVAMVSFVQLSGVFAALSWVVDAFLLGLVWWCAHKLTWDCTLIDESQDASGQGLLQTMGLDGEGPTESQPKVNLPLWERWFGDKSKRPHTPGVWVVYFSLAALPLFGMGQWFIAADNTASRRYTFWLLVVYVASGLALLLTTSFLGLRRYLRQRQMEMPADMATVWVGLGGTMIVALLVFCFLLPRPRAEYPVSQLPFEFKSPLKWPSRWGFGNDGPQDNSKGSRTGPQSQSGGQDSGGSGQGSGKPDSGEKPGGSSGEGGNSQGGGTAENTSPGNSADNPSKQQTPEAGGSSTNGNQAGSDSGSGGASDKPKGEQQPENSGGSNNSQQTSQSQAAAQSNPNPSNSSFSLSSMLNTLAWFFGSLLKLVFYILLASIAGYFAWRYRQELVLAFKKFVEELRAWWARLFGRKQSVTTVAPTGPAKPVYKRFAEFADPFASGLAARLSPAELVKYTFEALEAWGREHNCPRAPQQTPHEFAEQLARGNAALASSAGVLADLYCRAAYAVGTLSPANVQQLQPLWRVLTTA